MKKIGHRNALFPNHPAVHDPPHTPPSKPNRDDPLPPPAPISYTPAFTDCWNGRQKIAFEAQRLEIASLHSAEQRAVTRTSRIRKQLGTSELELGALEREMNEIGVCCCRCCTVHAARANDLTVTAAFFAWHAPPRYFPF